MFKNNTLVNMGARDVRNGNKRDKSTNEVGQGHQNRSHYTDTSFDLSARQSQKEVSNLTTQRVTGSAKSTENPAKIKTYQEVKMKDVAYQTIIYERTRSFSEVQGHLNSSYKSSSENEPYISRKSNTEQTKSKRPLGNDEIKKGKKRKDDHLEQVNLEDHINKEDIERIIEAILAVYGMSNVPESEIPNVPKQSKKINKEMREELFKSCPTIKRVGYRYRTFHIYAVQPVRHDKEEIRNNKIHSLMKKYDISPYKIAQCDEEIQELRHTGAKIEARSETHYSLRSRRESRPKVSNGGTLGGFVKTEEGDQQYCLLSKHVTETCSDIFYVENGNNELLGHMLPETNRHVDSGLDISAARMNGPVEEESAKFKDTRGIPLNGKLHKYNEKDEDVICRSGQSVHIYGAVTRPGKGEITMPIVHTCLTSPLIQVEDISEDGVHFAEKGDSGAVICVEDPERKHIHALGMVMGDVSKNSPKRKYLALPLSKGIHQIKEQTGIRLELV